MVIGDDDVYGGDTCLTYGRSRAVRIVPRQRLDVGLLGHVTHDAQRLQLPNPTRALHRR